MNNRLQQFLSLENLTPSALADLLGVQRSGLSHILSGRNKPGYDFIKRLLTKFPQLNADWLILGKGKPYKDFLEVGSPTNKNFYEEKGENKIQLNNQQYNNIPLNNQQYDSISFEEKQYKGMPLNEQQYNNIPSQKIQSNDISLDNQPILDDIFTNNSNFEIENTTQNTIQSTDNEQNRANNSGFQQPENSINAQTLGVAGKKKNVKRVIIFYNDGSFEELFPLIR